ncbi:MAG: hypothetical protein ACK4SY_07210 [Pyrobaculum sp.]
MTKALTIDERDNGGQASQNDENNKGLYEVKLAAQKVNRHTSSRHLSSRAIRKTFTSLEVLNVKRGDGVILRRF